MLLCAKAGSTGLNLIGAQKMIMFEPDWNPKNDSQVIGRIWRIGQTKPVDIYRLFICGTIEEKILQRQMNKEKISENVVDDKMSISVFDKDELKEIFKFKSDKYCLAYKEDEN